MNLKKILATVEFLKWKLFGISLGAWAGSLLVFVLVFIGLRWTRRLLVRWLAGFASRTETKVDDLIVGLVRETSSFFLLAVSLYAGLLVLAPRPRVLAVAGAGLALVFFLQVGRWGNQIISYAVVRLSRSREEENHDLRTAVGALGFIGRFALWSIIALLILSTLHINITALVAGLGVGGVAVALAVQNILGDLFASLSIVLDKPFALGHFIVVDTLAGTVEHVGVKSTRIRSLSGEEIVLSNADLLKSRIHNYKRLYERRILFSFGVTYDTAYEKLVAIPPIVRQVVEGVPKTRFDRAHFKEFGDFSLNFEVVYFVLDPNYNLYMDIQQAINLGLYKSFQEQDIEFAYPTQTLYLQHQNQLSAAPSAGTLPPNRSPNATTDKD